MSSQAEYGLKNEPTGEGGGEKTCVEKGLYKSDACADCVMDGIAIKT